jgi:phospholipase C
MYASNSAYTHSSFLHFLQNLWGLKGLNNRVQWAKTFEYVFSDNLHKDCPTSLPVAEWVGRSTQTQPAPFYLLNQDEDYYAKLSS